MADAPSTAAPPDAPAAPPLHVLHVVERDGFERFGPMFRQLGFALSNEGLRVSLLTDDLSAALALDGTPIIDYYTPHLHGLAAWRLGAQLAELFPEPPDVVHLWGVRSLSAVSRWARASGATLTIHLTSHEDVDRLRHHRTRPHERMLALTHALAEAWTARPAGTDDDLECRLAAPGLLPPSAATPLLPPGRTLGILWSGRMTGRHGLPILIDAVARLRTQAPAADLHLALIGRGSDAPSLWRRIHAAKVHDCISFTDGLDLWARAAPGCDALVVPAPQTEVALAPLWAMAAGRIVLAARGQPADWFIHDETCWHFDPAAPDELAALLQRLLDRLPAVHGVARAAAAYVARRHGITALAARLVEVYRAARGQPAPPRDGPRLHT